MATPSEHLLTLDHPATKRSLTVLLASSKEEIEQCQKLRWNIFAKELRAQLSSPREGYDIDEFDQHCMHLMVMDTKTNKVVATTRLLTNDGARETGRFYSETEFEISSILNMNRSLMEVGRTCVHANYRKGAALAMLWQGLARMAAIYRVDYLIGCASIPLSYGDAYIASLMDLIRTKYHADSSLHVSPRVPLPKPDIAAANSVILPTLLKAYLRQGAVICGEPHWDLSFNVADVFVLLDIDKLSERYMKHFVARS